MKTLTIEEAAVAWASKHEVEARARFSKTWVKIAPVGFVISGLLSPSVLSDATYSFRLATKKRGAK